MKMEYTPLINEAIKTEELMSDLYELLSRIFPDHKPFFDQLSHEEKVHSALLKSALKYFSPFGVFPQDLIYPNMENLRHYNSELHSTLKFFRETIPSIHEALDTSINLERTGAESQFHQAMLNAAKSDDKSLQIFSEVLKGFKSHAERLFIYRNRLESVKSKEDR